MRSYAPALLLFALAATIPPGTAYADASSPGRTARDVHARGRYPSDLAVMPSTEAGDAAGGGRGGGDAESAPRPRGPVRLYRSGGADTSPPPRSDIALPSLGPLGQALGWLLVGVSALLVIAALVYGLSQLRLRRDPAADIAAHAPKADANAEIDPLLVAPELSADELARLGRYREAIHALLVSALLATGFRPEGRARGSTAREVVSGVAASDGRKGPLVALLADTELVWFGGREATSASFERARALHDEVRRGPA